ncbi:MAG TPA: VOC family protein [Vicinamibacterales bacterium]|nr:VOC family protein [Vicinamibacterales bacterium]
MADRLLGSFVWCELMTTETAAAQSFYNTVAAWTAAPFAPDGSYTVFNNASGAGVAGMMKLPDAAQRMGSPPNWMMYVGTPSADDTAGRIAQLGGRVLKQPEDIPDTGRFAVVQDPFGATFGLFQPPADRPGKSGQPGVGDFSWFELYTPNIEGAWKFYQALFGWEKTSAMDMGEMGRYQMFGRGGGIPNGGIMTPPPGAPAAWMPYIRVKDAKDAAALATANGGKIVNGPMEVPGGDWIAQGVDPQGAMFAVHSLKPAAQTSKPGKTKTKAKATPARKSAKPVKKGRRQKAEGRKKTAKKKVAKKKAAKKKAAKRKK